MGIFTWNKVRWQGKRGSEWDEALWKTKCKGSVLKREKCPRSMWSEERKIVNGLEEDNTQKDKTWYVSVCYTAAVSMAPCWHSMIKQGAFFSQSLLLCMVE